MQCKNCKTSLSIEDRFCNNCGARVVDQRLTFRYLANDISERFFDLDNNLLLRTIKNMFSRPEEVIGGYIEGVRRKHLSVANYVALAITLAGLQLFIVQKFFPESMDVSWMGQENNPVLENGTFLDSMMEYNSLLYILFIPVYAIISRIVFFNYKKYSYLGHIVIIGYTQSHLGIVLFIPILIALALGANYFMMSYVTIFIMVVFSSYCYKRLFQLSWGKLILKLLLFLVIGLFFWIGIGILMWVYLFATGQVDMQELIEASKAQQGMGYIASSAMNWTS